jgi:nucleoid DNA-binding protein
MLKSELAEILSHKTNLPKAATLEGLREILDCMTEVLKANESIEIRNFGRFSVRQHINRRARNPKTGEMMQLKKHKLAHFHPSKFLIKRLNEERLRHYPPPDGN